MTWDPTVPDQSVRIKNNPGRRGITTGTTRQSSGRLLVLVNFGPNEKTYKPYDQLELCDQPETIRDLLTAGRFGTPDDLRRILTFEKVRGQLTNIFYSMESSNTDFYPHQFKPVMKFLDSPVGRLLIADEVGLGKTVEAIYIWKELQAREDARRLLIVCPALLRQKWKDDLRNRFNIAAEITDLRHLHEKVQLCVNDANPQSHSFVCIASLEGLRPPRGWEDLEDEEVKGTRAELAWLLDQKKATDEFGVFDLVVIDEAHYLRNPGTVSNQLGNLLREAARHLVLLTATPIQIHSDNLYQLLKLISPEDFFDPTEFGKMLEANKPVIEAQRLVWRTPPDIEQAKQAVDRAIQSEYFSNHQRLQRVQAELQAARILCPEEQVQLRQNLESSGLFGQFMTRSRKRDVFEDRVERLPQSLNVHFAPLEQQIYETITHQIRQQARGQQGVSLFRLISRQRQMASCMVAALESWQNQGILDDLLQAEEEQILEDFGISAEDWGETDWQSPTPNIEEVDLEQLRVCDSKYQVLLQFLRKQLREKSDEKFVLFAYFRRTLHYLQERLEKDGIHTCLIQGGMGDQKQEVLKNFRHGKPSILLSSEVGSEGIDLQFCRFLINYDLPWNPMRVEQRIGRLDRIGQKAENISIINFSIKDTIEETVLERLYDRIEIFKESIGDLEEILGQETEKLLIHLFDPKLNDEQRQKRAEETLRTIANKKADQEKLEEEAINMMAFSDYILNTIKDSRSRGRWLQPRELQAFVEDFFRLQFPGTVIRSTTDEVFDISLSPEAKVDLRLFCERQHLSSSTRLYSSTQHPVPCFFNAKLADSFSNANYELLDPTHPLIQWIQNKYEAQESATNLSVFHRVSASQLEQSVTRVPTGTYVYLVHYWHLEGLRRETRLAYRVIRLADNHTLTDDEAEGLINWVALAGEQRPNIINLVDMNTVLELYEQAEDDLQIQFSEEEEQFQAENEDWCSVQERSARAYADRKRLELEERIARLRAANKLRTIRMDEGKIRKIEQDLQTTLSRIDRKRADITTKNPALAAGIIVVN